MTTWEGALLGVSGQLKSIVKHRILGAGKNSDVCKKGELILMIYTSCDVFLHKKLTFGVTVIVRALKFSGVNFLKCN